jgi:glycosyltransferase involved in cell wall biosynthesis
MRVLWFTNIPLPALAARQGGEERLDGGWLDALRAEVCRRSDVELAVATTTSEPMAPFCDDGVTYYGVEMAPLSRRRVRRVVARWRHIQASPGALDRCRHVVDGFGAQLVHVHGTERFFGLIAGTVDIPVVASLQGILGEYVQHFFAGLALDDVLREAATRDFVCGHGWLHTYLDMRKGARQERAIVRRCDAVLGRTAWDRAFAARMNPQAPYFEGPELLRPPFYGGAWAAGSGARRPTLLTVTGAAPYKGVEMLMAAAAALRRRGRRDVDIRIAGSIVGSPMWPVLSRRLRRFGVEDAVTWLGPLPADGLVRELEKASVFVLPSHIENSPNSLCEAMMVGTPCVASRVGGVPSLLDHGKEGLLFADGDVDALCDGVLRLVDDEAFATSCSAAGGRWGRWGGGAGGGAPPPPHDPERAVRLLLEAYTAVRERYDSAAHAQRRR